MNPVTPILQDRIELPGGFSFSVIVQDDRRVLYSPDGLDMGMWRDANARAFAAAMIPAPGAGVALPAELVAFSERIVTRLENARSDWFACEADTEEAVEIVSEELRTLAAGRKVEPQGQADGWQPIETAPRNGVNIQLRNNRFGASPMRWVWDPRIRAWWNGMQWWRAENYGPEEWRVYSPAPAQDREAGND